MLTMAKKSRRGRTRKLDAKRQPDGRVKPEVVGPSPETLDRRIDALSALIIQFPRKFAAERATDPDASWYIGRLYLCGQLTVAQKDAAERYHRAATNFKALLSPPQAPRALDMNRITGTANEDEDLHARRFKRAKAAYERLHDAISIHGHDVVRAVTNALKGEDVRLEWLRKGLDAIDGA